MIRMSEQSSITPILPNTDKSIRNMIPIPEVLSELCLHLFPYVMLLGLAFTDDVFAALALTGPEYLARLRIPPGLY